MIEKATGAADGSQRKTVTFAYHLDKEYTLEELNAMIARFMARYK